MKKIHWLFLEKSIFHFLVSKYLNFLSTCLHFRIFLKINHFSSTSFEKIMFYWLVMFCIGFYGPGPAPLWTNVAQTKMVNIVRNCDSKLQKLLKKIKFRSSLKNLPPVTHLVTWPNCEGFCISYAYAFFYV